MDAEERRSLEAELAAELAGLSDVVDDDGDELEAVHHGDNARETTSSPGISGGESAFVRLDLDRLLRQLASSDQDAHKQRTQQSSGVRGDGDGETMSSWGLLLASVQTSDAEFFQFIRQDLHDIQTTILTSPTDSNATSSPASKADLAQCEANSTQKSGYGDPAASALASPLTISEIGSPAIENGVGNDKSEQIQASDGDPEPKSRGLFVPSDDSAMLVARPWSPARDSDRVVPEDRVSKRRELPESSQGAVSIPSALQPEPLELSVRDEESQLLLDQARQNQLQLIQEQHLTRQRQLQRTQEARQLKQEAIARQIQEMDMRFAEEEEKQTRREVEQRQAKERLAMQKEEVMMRKCVSEAQRLGETEQMVLEERISRVCHDFSREEQRNRERERLAMASEEALEWKRVRFEAEKRRRERLMEEKCVLRRRFNTVVFQLLANHEAKVAEQKKQEDATKKREARELTLMRSEELSQHRVFVQRRALKEERNRNREREVMAHEDAFSRVWAAEMAQQMNKERLVMEREDRLATEIRSAAEKRQQDVNRLLMAREEERSRMAQVLEIQREHLRVRRQEACRRILVHRKRVALLGLAWGTWQCVVADEMEVVLRIQRCYRTYMRHRRIHECEDEGETTPEYASEEAAAAAAMVVQSMFRGFSIRRKFANALEMAQLVGGVDELEFGEVNLDDLIQMPPELEDGWENPVLPASRCYQQQSVASVMNQFDGEEGPESGDYEDPEQPEYENYAPVVDSAMDRVTRGGGGFQYANGAATSQLLPLEDSTPPAPAPPASLASNLWDKMRKMKQKQRHAAEERSREQDPTYRLQKLMSKGNKKPPQQSTKATSNNHNGNQSHAAPNTTASNAPTISWGSSNSNGEKKKPKVKLPSLVERLRKKTEAAR